MPACDRSTSAAAPATSNRTHAIGHRQRFPSAEARLRRGERCRRFPRKNRTCCARTCRRPSTGATTALHPHSGGRYGVRLELQRSRRSGRLTSGASRSTCSSTSPLPHRYRTLALRAGAVLTDTDAGQRCAVLLTSRRSAAARRCAASASSGSAIATAWSFSAEYRWEAWWTLDAARSSSTPAPSPRSP